MSSNATIYRDALATAIQGVAPTGLQTTSVIARRRPWDENGTVINKGITVHDVDYIEAHGTEAREDIGYKFAISAYVGSDHSSIEGIDRIPAWFEAIRKKIINRRLTVTLASGDTNLIVQMTDGQLHVPKESLRYELSTMFVICFAREARTA